MTGDVEETAIRDGVPGDRIDVSSDEIKGTF